MSFLIPDRKYSLTLCLYLKTIFLMLIMNDFIRHLCFSQHYQQKVKDNYYCHPICYQYQTNHLVLFYSPENSNCKDSSQFFQWMKNLLIWVASTLKTYFQILLFPSLSLSDTCASNSLSFFLFVFCSLQEWFMLIFPLIYPLLWGNLTCCFLVMLFTHSLPHLTFHTLVLFKYGLKSLY